MSGQVCVSDIRPQFRLRQGQDDLLIEWLLSFKPRQRSQAIRDALRGYLSKSSIPQAEGRWDEDPDLADALDALF